MASFENRNGRTRVVIRRKNVEISATFDTEESAQLWAKYKDRLIDEMHNFDVPKKDLIIFSDSIKFKMESLQQNKSHPKTVTDIRTLLNTFSEFNDLEMSKITYEMILSKAQELLNSITRKGGSKNNPDSGRKQQMSPHTVMSRLRQLSSVYSNLLEMGVQIDNIPLKVIAYLKNLIGTDEIDKKSEEA